MISASCINYSDDFNCDFRINKEREVFFPRYLALSKPDDCLDFILPTKAIRVVSLNVRGDQTICARLPGLNASIDAFAPTVLGLQEYPSELVDIQDQLSDQWSNPIVVEDTDFEQTIWFSDTPYVESGGWDLEGIIRGARFKRADNILYVNVHFPLIAEEGRSNEILDLILTEVDKISYTNIVIMGDFNMIKSNIDIKLSPLAGVGAGVDFIYSDMDILSWVVDTTVTSDHSLIFTNLLR